MRIPIITPYIALIFLAAIPFAWVTAAVALVIVLVAAGLIGYARDLYLLIVKR